MCCEWNTQFRWRQHGWQPSKETTAENSLNRFCSLNSVAHNLFYCACIYLRSRSSYDPYVCSATVCAYATIYTSYAFPFVASHSHARTSCIGSHWCVCRQTTGISIACVYTHGPRVVYRRVAVRAPWVKITIYSVVEIGRERIALLLLARS